MNHKVVQINQVWDWVGLVNALISLIAEGQISGFLFLFLSVPLTVRTGSEGVSGGQLVMKAQLILAIILHKSAVVMP